jgi:hypothetical protein
VHVHGAQLLTVNPSDPWKGEGPDETSRRDAPNEWFRGEVMPHDEQRH